MKFTKHNVLVLSACIGVAVVGAKLSLKPMERQAAQQRQPRLHPHGPAYVPLLQMRFGLWTSARIDFIIQEKNKKLIEDLQSDKALDEFRDFGTFEGKPLRFESDEQLKLEGKQPNTLVSKIGIISDDWAIKYLKPALVRLVSPWDNNVQVLEDDGKSIQTAVFSPDDTMIMTASDYHIVIWGQSGKGYSKLYTWRTFPENIMCTFFKPDGKKIIAVINGAIYIVPFSANTKGIISNDFPETLRPYPKGKTTFAVFSSDGNKIATIQSRDEKISIYSYDPAKDQWKREAILLEESDFLSFSHNNKKMISSSFWGKIICIFDYQNEAWKKIQTFQRTDGAFSLYPRSAVFSPDDNKIVATFNNKVVSIWEYNLLTNSWGQDPLLLKGHTEEVSFATFGPNNETIVSASYDKTARIWLFNGKNGIWEESHVLQGHTDSVVYATFNSNGTRVVTASKDGTARVWAQTDLVGTNNVAEKILLLQLLNRGGSQVFDNRPHLQATFATFSKEAQDYLKRKYEKIDWTNITP